MIYMDNAATTVLHREALDAMLPYFTEMYGNPASVYEFAQKSKNAVEDAREKIADVIGAEKNNEIYFTAGGSESDNWAIKSAANALKDKGRHIITTKIEHPAVLNSCAFLEKAGYEVTYLDVDEFGYVSPAAVEAALTDSTILISVMMANNEIGTIEPIREIGELAHRHGILFHTDAVQAVCHIPIDVQEMNIDLLSASAHKFHGPKGVGFLYMNKGTKLEPLIHGGSQERARRAGTLNVSGIVGAGEAARLTAADLKESAVRIAALRDYMVGRIMNEIPDVIYDGPKMSAGAACGISAQLRRLPGNMHFCFRGVAGESLLILLDMAGICASSGSACASGSVEPSHVLTAIGRNADDARGALRLSIGDDIKREDADTAVDAIKSAVARLRGE